ncbi:hypothetical protein L249_4195 [Ophiocordyceps polyrhachis-furcata BCC 54312]|uniref:Uncharacterized protein n=1 Tax=Ophiocordyceps polyrhachis-furcata BCC 54312 TaxID=1330021 RepID=A0A367LBX9_9HYPO|nr:hypothetical protein L249_4195 [Ophiocordyceps polyrhachis-furcata BCC 54312]
MVKCRGLSTSRPVQFPVMPPESPAYIRLPATPQLNEPRLPRVRGHLPIPREIFPAVEGDRKIKPQYIRDVSPMPAHRCEARNESQRWKLGLADRRRRNLEHGLRALWARRTESDRLRKLQVSSTMEQHKRAAAAPEREDDRLTRTTILEQLMDTKVHPDPDRLSRVARSREELLARESAKRECRLYALTELYINASNFIITEKELDDEVEYLFREDYFQVQGHHENRLGMMENVWGLFGKPPSIANMLREDAGRSAKMADQHASEYERSVHRHKRITEDLTGGKML